MTSDPMRFSETYDPPPRDRPDASEYDSTGAWLGAAARLVASLTDVGDEYESWLDTLDHHTIGECDCERCQCEDVAA